MRNAERRLVSGLSRITGMTTGSGKRPVVVISTEDKTADQMKAEARSALSGLFAAQDGAKDND
jgi:hypothetical protein